MQGFQLRNRFFRGYFFEQNHISIMTFM